jgi:GNAT superfamily N-acetyltransferase
VHENRLSDPNRIGLDDYREMLERDGKGWVIEADGRIVAFGIADRTRRNIWALFVQPGYEGRGFGRRLLTTMREWLCDEGCDVIWLTTDPGTRAERFYRKAGWRGQRSVPGSSSFAPTFVLWLATQSHLPSLRIQTSM